MVRGACLNDGAGFRCQIPSRERSSGLQPIVAMPTKTQLLPYGSHQETPELEFARELSTVCPGSETVLNHYPSTAKLFTLSLPSIPEA